MNYFIVTEEGKFQLSGQVNLHNLHNLHNLRIVDSENPYESLDHEGTIPKLFSLAVDGNARIRRSCAKLITKFSVAFGRHLNIDYVASAPHGAHIAFY